MDNPFVMEQCYKAPIEKVWAALTHENHMRAWYFPQLEKFQPVVGFAFEFVADNSPYQKDWRVTQVEKEKKLAHSWQYKGYAGGSEVTFELVAEGAGTRLKLTHSGLASFPPDPHFARSRFEAGWQRILGSNLKYYLEKNLDNLTSR
ncbi:SRPBCC domain-containing protein [Hymenobacter sp. YC55]|uniref:SRPBCC family protein n=1 Tax=Hymenobacter sp. YC55 TaxID=3034019 RepID=UPI0023F62EF8|nr:SRPBCC domain-containing protein [Hymenobacter sp. YC55]MDF7814200.1 SRPBCC domain-containing protein [Hymenobacter sp. YC55]